MKLKGETSDETVPDHSMTDQDVNTQARPGQEDIPGEVRSDEASAQGTKGQLTLNKPTSSSE